MKKVFSFLLCSLFLVNAINAQDEEKGFKLSNLFTGGGINAGFSNNTFLLGASPMFGYNLTKWADAGILFNYSYSSTRDYYNFNDKLRQNTVGGGGFVRLYPIRFLFAQAQFEHNVITQKYYPVNGGNIQKISANANSFLVGAGYSTSRDPYAKQPFFFMSIMFDLMGEYYSPYVDVVTDPNTGAQAVRKVPVIKAGIQVPLFQGRSGDYQSY